MSNYSSKVMTATAATTTVIIILIIVTVIVIPRYSNILTATLCPELITPGKAKTCLSVKDVLFLKEVQP